MTEIPQQLLGHFTPEWQRAAIASAFVIVVLTIGVTEVIKRQFGYPDESLPPKDWKRKVMGLAFCLGFVWSLLLIPLAVDGTHYEVAVKVLVIAVANGVASLLGFDTIKFALRMFRAYVIEWVRAKVRKKLIEEPSQRHEDVDWNSTIVKWANSGKAPKP